ncbi:exodeoxyribonuclease V alpha subunit [Salinibacillus kushneri]|uniref:ATP-dependent RecD2 DNA helicase n=1 Tax=Salinibacillus kushneri TaxID=237682 RepID=A0A1I0G8W0_9BACI|nr:ATP-dependent RecD-like DNA helicase [Salinibacillus kushneri]SET66351.1 exodeoxyribonuclease V alpha subunit [Salinibacillus kushneri]
MAMDSVHEEKGYIKGSLLRTIFHNAEERFSIALIRIIDTNEPFKDKEIVVKGHFPPLEQEQEYIFYGNLSQHAKFGQQYQVFTYTREIPKTKDSLVRYLSSDIFYGVGKKSAEKIVDALGETAIDKILKDENILAGIPGFPQNIISSFSQTLRENQGFERVVMALADYGIGLQLTQKIYDIYKEETLKLLEENPYQFVFEVEGFGFRRADEIAKILGISGDHPTRIQAGCIHTLKRQSQFGHVFEYLEQLCDDVRKLLNETDPSVTNETIEQKVKELSEEGYLIIEENRVYLPSLYFSEEGVSSQLKRIMDIKLEDEYTQADILKALGEIEEKETISYGREQYEAIEQALNSKAMILTGGPGTGKTTVIKGIIGVYERLNPKKKTDKDKQDESGIILAAPTGRAAKRMTEATGHKAQTIHRLLGWSGNEEFEFNQSRQLDAELIIIDEFSMVDIWLANQLFRAIPSKTQIVLVGDEDQLPSVGPGQVLTDFLASEVIPTCKLTEIYRQKEGSRIVELAHEIKNNQCDGQSLKRGEDFSFFQSYGKHTLTLLQDIVKKAVDKGYSIRDIQVLAPMYRSNIGINILNEALQELLNPRNNQKRSIQFNDQVFRSGDKMIQLVNQPEKGVFNGDIGHIVTILKADETEENQEQLVVDFDGKEVHYVRSELHQLMHAYCISIHKSQGSEFPIVVMPVVPDYRRMLRKNLLYTAITRSKQSLIICGDQRAFLEGVRTEDQNVRNTTLAKRMEFMFAGETMQGEERKEEMAEVDDEELSPYDFM